MKKLLYVCLLVLAMSTLPHANAQEALLQSSTQAAVLQRNDFIGMVVRDPYYEWGSAPGKPNEPNREFQDFMGKMLARAGVEWVRLEIHIRSGDVIGELKKQEYFINTVAPRYKLKVLALLAFDIVPGRDLWQLNCVKATEPEKCIVDSSGTYGGGVNQYMQTWLDNALVTADYFGTNIHAYEVLNEQNRLPAPYGGKAIDPQIAARLTAKFFRFCHNQGMPVDRPTAHTCGERPIILGGLHPRGTSDSTGKIVMTDAEYLGKTYDADGDSGNKNGPFGEYKATYGGYPIDGIAYHPYPVEIRASRNTRQDDVDFGIDRVQAVMERYDKGQQFWITEIGYNIGYYQNTPSELGAFTRDIFTTLADRMLKSEGFEMTPAVANVFWFKYEDFAPAEGKDAQKWGIVRIPFSTDSTRPDGVRYQTGGFPVEFRDSYTAIRDMSGAPLEPPRAYFPLIER